MPLENETEDTRTPISQYEFEEKVRAWVDRNVYRNASNLITDLLRLSAEVCRDQTDLVSEFNEDSIENERQPVDESNWTIKQFREFIVDLAGERSSSLPLNDPETMDADEMIDTLLDGYVHELHDELEEGDDDSQEALEARAKLELGNMPTAELKERMYQWIEDNERDDWIDGANEVSADNPRDILEWWAVSADFIYWARRKEWPFIDNSYGEWWGRTTSGQSITQDEEIRALVAQIHNVRVVRDVPTA